MPYHTIRQRHRKTKLYCLRLLKHNNTKILKLKYNKELFIKIQKCTIIIKTNKDMEHTTAKSSVKVN